MASGSHPGAYRAPATVSLILSSRQLLTPAPEPGASVTVSSPSGRGSSTETAARAARYDDGYSSSVLFWPSKEPAPSLPTNVEAGLYKLHLPDAPSDLAGYLSVRPDHAYEVEGPWWNRRWVRPRLVGDWYVDFWDFDTHLAWPDGALSYGISDGFPFEADGFEELAGGTFLLHGVLFSVERVDPAESPNEYGTHFHFLDLAEWKRARSAR